MTTKAVSASSEDVGLLTFKSLGNFCGLTAEKFFFFHLYVRNRESLYYSDSWYNEPF